MKCLSITFFNHNKWVVHIFGSPAYLKKVGQSLARLSYWENERSVVLFLFLSEEKGQERKQIPTQTRPLDNIDIDHQYAEVKTNKPNKNKPLTPKLGNNKH